MNGVSSIAMALCTALVLSACSKKSDDITLVKKTPDSAKGSIQESDAVSSKDLGNLNFSVDSNWATKDPVADGEEGMSSDKALSELSLPQARDVIVAVIDSGVDVHHEDLQGKIWNNPGETGLDESGADKANNGVDDDGNGYVDDVYGWNFIGGADGSHIDFEQLEMTRELVKLKKKKASGVDLSEAELKYFAELQSVITEEKEGAEASQKRLQPMQDQILTMKKVLEDRIQQGDFSKEAISAIVSSEKEVIEAKSYLLAVYDRYGSLDRIARALEYYDSVLKYYLNEDFNPRAEIVKDNPDDFSDLNYGNNDVIGPDASHGTHVSGIITANRSNGLGMDGVAPNVKIMVLRVVPNGDERDKDVALAVKYAADNGAKIINMSFGKAYGSNKAKVDEAFLYAQAKGVLMLHAAGNDNKDIDFEKNFPNKQLENSVMAKSEIEAWMTIGASSKLKSLGLPADFSNYGKKNVDVFAPGHNILSSVPGDKYAVFSGTSMACPAAAGAAALLLSHYPSMTALQAKSILKYSARTYPGFEVRLPGADVFDLPVMFEKLSDTGAIVDAYSALALSKKLAEGE